MLSIRSRCLTKVVAVILDKRPFAGYRKCVNLAEWISSAWTCLGIAGLRFPLSCPAITATGRFIARAD